MGDRGLSQTEMGGYARANKDWLRLAITIVFLVLNIAAFGQTNRLVGSMVDSLEQPLSSVSLVLLSPEDSSLVYFTTTDPEGNFEIERIAKGRYLMQASFIGFQTFNKILEFSGEGKTINLDTIALQEERNVLSEVVVQGQRIPIIINKDTVSYQAGAFNVRADENVEDLLKRLPGIEVDADGQVTAQGQEVTKVMVDGKEFFGGNVQIATQNLPADAIERIKFYDRQSEQAMYTGVDDGEREKTMDLELKEDRKKGVFGNIEAGAGTDERFKLKGGVHAFTSTSRLSILGNANNLNEYGFSWSDYMDMLNGDGNGGSRRGISYISFNSNSPVPMSWSAPNNGVFTSRSGGLNFNHDPNKKHRLNLTYFYTELNHNLIQNTQGSEFNPERVVSVNEDQLSNEQQRSHSGMMTYRWDPDSLNRFEFTGSLSLREQNGNDEYNSNYSNQDGTTFQTGDRETQNENESLQYQLDLDYTHRFQKEKRHFTLSGYGERSESDVEDLYQSLNTFPLDSRIEFIDQLRMNMGTNESYRFDASYTEPLAEDHLLSLELEYSDNLFDTKTDVFDQEGGSFRPALSPWYQLERNQYSAELEYQYLIDDQGSQVTANLPVNYIRQVASDIRGDQTIDPDPWLYFLPSVSWRKESKDFGRIRVSIRRDLNLPQLSQWIANPDSTNPLSVRLGNPNLEPGIGNNLSMSYYNYNSFNQTSRHLRVWGGIDQNPIVSSQSIDDDFTRIIQPVNTSEPRYNLGVSGSYRFPITAWKIFLRPGVRYSYSQVNEPLNGLINRHRNQSLSPSLSISNFRSNKLSVSASGDWDFNWANYSLQSELNNYFVNHNYRLKLTYTPTKRLSLRSELSYRLFSQERFGESVAIPLLTSSVSYSFLSDRTLTLKLLVFDILGQNTGIERMVQGNNIYQVQANNLTRYGLLSVIWRFRKQ